MSAPAHPAAPGGVAGGGPNMDFGLDDAQQALVDAAVGILEARCTPERLAAADASEGWYDLDLWAELAAADVVGLAVPEAEGGLGFGILEACLVGFEIGRFVAPVPFVPTATSAALTLGTWATGEHRAMLGDLARGRWFATAALSEPGVDAAGSARPRTTARREGGGWRIDGHKTLVPGAHLASVVLTPADTPDGAAVFVVPTSAEGLRCERQRVTGLEPHFALTYDGVVVPDEARLGEASQGPEVLRSLWAHTVCARAAVAAGVAERAVRITAAYTTERHQFGRPIATFQAVETRLADAYICARAMRLTALCAATRLAEGRDATLEVATAKYWCAEGGNVVGHTALHCHGGISIDLDYPIHRYFLWAKQHEFTLGSAPDHLRAIGRRLAGA